MSEIERSLDHAARQELHARLRAARSQLLRTASMTEEELATLEAREPGAAIEGAARDESIGILARLEDRERHEIEEIDAALARLRASTYGTCESCGGRIPLPRLQAMPTTRYCVTCQAIRE
ncbi:MAG TPA: TraR/DksA family transcriptional regulator [Methylomirabilota bacterium]|nr:TraR/DksA family transcriptional regulator [Methylomirabilota bacterium]